MRLLTEIEARFVVRVMDSLHTHPALLDDKILVERKKLDALYVKHGSFSQGSEKARAEWLLQFIARDEKDTPNE